MVFTKKNEKIIMDSLRIIPIHDSVFKNIEFVNGNISVVLKSFAEDQRIKMQFYEVQYSAFHPSIDWGGDESICSFSVIENTSEIQDVFLIEKNKYADCMFFLFELFSGSKLRIVCKKMLCEQETQKFGFSE